MNLILGFVAAAVVATVAAVMVLAIAVGVLTPDGAAIVAVIWLGVMIAAALLFIAAVRSGRRAAARERRGPEVGRLQ